MINKVKITEEVTIGTESPVVLISGPCAIESLDHCLFMADSIKKICEKMSIPYIFKASFDKANRTKLTNYRGLPIEEAASIFKKIRKDLGVPVITDFHEPWQAEILADCVDILQIPAFLCRQTDMLVAAAKTGLAVNIKKGQFVSGYDTDRMVNKVSDSGNSKVFLTERGNTFGYGDYVVDYRNLVVMRDYTPVVFDVGHSLQKGCSGGSSGSNMHFAEPLMRAALAVGVDGIFMECHDNPDKALSDGTSSVKLSNLEEMLQRSSLLWRK